MTQTSASTAGAIGRYSQALLELATEAGKNKLDSALKDAAAIEEMLASSEDFRRFTSSPIFGIDEQLNALNALLKKAKISGLVANFVYVVARNRRLPELGAMLASFRALAAEQRGEITAEVISAEALNAAQTKDLIKILSDKTGKTITLQTTVDSSIIGGLVVKLGSQMLDASLKTKLNTLRLTLREVA